MKYLQLLFILILLFCYNSIALSQENINTSKPFIDSIQIQGLQLIAQDRVLTQLSSHIHSRFSATLVTQDIRALYRLGFFNNIKAITKQTSPNHINLIFKVQENKRIGTIRFKGIAALSKTTVKDTVNLKLYSLLKPNSLTQAIRIIKQLYESKGFLQTAVSYKIKDIDQSSVSIVFTIKESPSNYLTQFHITGTHFFYPIDIERNLQSEKIDCFSWMDSSGVYQTAKINHDLQLVSQLYLQNGFIKVHINKPQVTIFKKQPWNTIHVGLHITEGEQYFAGNISVVSNDDKELLFNPDKEIKNFRLQKKDVFNPFLMQQDRAYITNIYGNQGYAFTHVAPETHINESSHTVDITYRITRGEKAYIDRIEIGGNYETQDQVIRRELEIYDNQLYSTQRLITTKENLGRLGFFKPGTGVQVIQEQTKIKKQTNELNYKVLVEEAQTGSFNGGLSYSGLNGVALNGTLAKKNLFGTGQSVNLSFEIFQHGQSHYNFTFITPYLFGSLFTQTINLYSSLEDYTNYDVGNYGFQYGLSYPIWRDITFSNTYAWDNESYSDISEIGKEELEDTGAILSHKVITSLSYSTVDNPMFPSSGLEASISFSQYGSFLGGDLDFQHVGFASKYFYPVNKTRSVVAMFSANLQQLIETNSNNAIPVHRRFTLGGPQTIRGFDWDQIDGPTTEAEKEGFDIIQEYPYRGDFNADEPCQTSACINAPKEIPEERRYYSRHKGGITQALFNAELLFPLTRQGNMLKGVVFYDMGNVWSEKRMYEISGKKRDFTYLRKSSGIGLRVITPMGVLHFDYGIKIDKRKYEESSRFDFLVSSLF